ncbi:hypothetical protein DFH08DRAFT_58940, partial [Mycena albidolilacea]
TLPLHQTHTLDPGGLFLFFPPALCSSSAFDTFPKHTMLLQFALLITLAGSAVAAPVKRCSVTNINGKVTIDPSGGGECSANGVNFGSDNGNGSGVTAGAFNDGELAAAFEDVAPIKKRCSVTNINGKVTIDNSGGGECSASSNGVNTSTNDGDNSGNNVGGANAGTFNGGDLAAKIKADIQAAQ